MIKIQGTLRVKKILQSRNGPFAVGNLSTDIGEFKVKDQVLDQFDEGSYQVTAWIVRIFIGHYMAAGRSIDELRAQLHDMQVQSEEIGDTATTGNDVVMDPDPLDEPPPVNVSPAAPTPDAALEALKAKLESIGIGRKSKDAAAAAPVPQEAPAPNDAVHGSLREFFSEDLWALIEARQPVKLDSTVERKLHRQQSSLLRSEELNYRFNSLDQTFYPV